MLNFSPFVIAEFIAGLFLWWIAIYLITRNPFSRLIQLIVGILASTSIYFSSDIIANAALLTDQTHYFVLSWKAVMWTIYLPIAFLYHVSYLLVPEKNRASWQKIFLFLNYILAAGMIYLETWTNLTRDYSSVNLSAIGGETTGIMVGKYFWLLGVVLTTSLIMTALNFYKIIIKKHKFSVEWYRYFWPLIGISLSFIFSPFAMLGYYNIIPHGPYFTSFVFVIISATLIYSIVKYDLFIEEAKIVFGKSFLYSTIGFLLVMAIYLLVFLASTIHFSSVESLLFPYLLIYLVIASHPIYNWLTTFINDIQYNFSSGLSVVSDQEVYQVLKSYNKQEKLEESPLTELNLIEKKYRIDKTKNPIDVLREIIKEAVEYFKPTEEPYRRTKQNLKYQLLKMLVFDEAEEGQMLWELGFDEYPTKIMSGNTEKRQPIFARFYPSDYTYTSRNAFLALKKEAIHDIAWRISYLEKLAKK